MAQRKFLNRHKIGSADWRRKAKEYDRKTIIRSILLGQDYETLLADSEACVATITVGVGNAESDSPLAQADSVARGRAITIRRFVDLEAEAELDIDQVESITDKKLAEFAARVDATMASAMEEKLAPVAATTTKRIVIEREGVGGLAARRVDVGVQHRNSSACFAASSSG